MSAVTNEALAAFNEAFDCCMKRVGGGKVALDSTDVRRAVRDHPKAARRSIELRIFAATSQPGYLQPAAIIAAAYQVEFGDDSLYRQVCDRAQALNATDVLASIGIGDTPSEPPEREAARAWWRETERTDGMCDLCRVPLKRGQGYLVKGRLVKLGESVANMATEILCESCFRKHRDAPRDPDPPPDKYFAV